MQSTHASQLLRELGMTKRRGTAILQSIQRTSTLDAFHSQVSQRKGNVQKWQNRNTSEPLACERAEMEMKAATYSMGPKMFWMHRVINPHNCPTWHPGLLVLCCGRVSSSCCGAGQCVGISVLVLVLVTT